MHSQIRWGGKLTVKKMYILHTTQSVELQRIIPAKYFSSKFVSFLFIVTNNEFYYLFFHFFCRCNVGISYFFLQDKCR